jgi:hypothetical protein
MKQFIRRTKINTRLLRGESLHPGNAVGAHRNRDFFAALQANTGAACRPGCKARQDCFAGQCKIKGSTRVAQAAQSGENSRL